MLRRGGTTSGAPPIIATTGRRGGIGQMSMRHEGGVAETGEALAWSAVLIVTRLALVLSILFWLWALGKYGCAGALFIVIIVYSLGWLERPTRTMAITCGALLLTAFVFVERVIAWPELARFQPLDTMAVVSAGARAAAHLLVCVPARQLALLQRTERPELSRLHRAA